MVSYIQSFQLLGAEPEFRAIDDHYLRMTDRNTGIVTSVEQQTISRVVVALAGAGGTSDVAITLAQMGFQHFRIADPDVFEVSNFNRQLGAKMPTLFRNKADVIAQEVLEINPDADVKEYINGVTWDNVEEFVDGADIVIDGLDISVMHLRERMFDLAREKGIPVFTCPIIGWGTGIAIFDPERSPSFREFFGEIPENPDSEERQRFNERYIVNFLSARPTGMDIQLSKRRARQGICPTIAAACRLNAALVCTAVYGFLFDKGSIPVVPITLHIDLLGTRMSMTGPKKRWLVRKAVGVLSKEDW